MNYCKPKGVILFLPFLLVALLSSCDPDTPTPPDEIIPGPVVGLSSYPLEVGNEWVYTMTLDVTGAENSYQEFVVDFEVVADTVIDGMPAKKVKSTETEGQNAGNDRLGYRFLTQTSSALDFVALNGPTTQVFFRLSEDLLVPNYSMVAFGQANINGVVVLDSAIHYMKFPSVDGNIWRSNEFGATSGAEFKRQWSGFYTVTTSAGEFDCMRMDLFGDYNQDNLPDSNSIFIQQYFSPEFGLIKEVATSELNWGSGQTGQYVRNLSLTSVNVQ